MRNEHWKTMLDRLLTKWYRHLAITWTSTLGIGPPQGWACFKVGVSTSCYCSRSYHDMESHASNKLIISQCHSQDVIGKCIQTHPLLISWCNFLWNSTYYPDIVTDAFACLLCSKIMSVYSAHPYQRAIICDRSWEKGPLRTSHRFPVYCSRLKYS